MIEMPSLETSRLLIRPFEIEDLEDAHRLFDIELSDYELHSDEIVSKNDRAEWLQWSILNYKHLAKLDQPPYGDRAIILKSNEVLVGSCGYVPCLNAFEQMPNFDYYNKAQNPGRYSPEFGLFYAVSPSFRRQGYASEAAQALIDYAFRQIQVKQVVATTSFDNMASIAVMRKLGMKIEKNPLAAPPWLQIVGVLKKSE